MKSGDISNAIPAELALKNKKIVKKGKRKKQQFFFKKNLNTLSTVALGNQILSQGWHNMLHKFQPTKFTILDV